MLQGVAAAVIAISGTFGQILSYVVSVDFIFFGLTGAALFVFRHRDPGQRVAFKVPGHPFTTGFFVLACWMVVVATVVQQPAEQPDRLRHPRRRRARLPLLAAQEPRGARMRTMLSEYMHWAKFKAPVRYQLTGSEVPHFRMDLLPISLADLDLDGASHPRYAPLRQAIAHRYGVSTDQVVAADGTSMANFLAMATLISPGDEVLVEQPTYELLLGAASFLGADIKRFERKPADGFRLDREAVDAHVGPNPPDRRHQPAQPVERARRRR